MCPKKTVAGYGAVSSETAEAMALGIKERANADYGISVTGIAGPDGGSDEKPVGTVFIGYADKDQTRSVKFIFPGDREFDQMAVQPGGTGLSAAAAVEGGETA
jgi:nicotinamide-nucleotide amidase